MSYALIVISENELEDGLSKPIYYLTTFHAI